MAGAEELWTPVRLRALRHGPVRAFYSLPVGVRVSIVEDADSCEEQLSAILRSDPDIVGLDTEWSDPQGTVALLQLATHESCVLVKLPMLSRVPDALRLLLVAERPLKCGVSVSQDLRLLQSQCGLSPCIGFLDLRVPAQHCDCADLGLGLAALCERVLGAPLCKAPQIRCSEWGGALSPAQVRYAANDAYVAVAILEEMHRQSVGGSGGGMLSWCRQFANQTKLGPQPQPHGPQPQRKQEAKLAPKQSKLYDGCRLLSPDGGYLYSVGRKKAKWYLNKSLADVVEEEPFTLRLRVLPGAHFMEPLYLQEAMNRCAGCNDEGSNVRFSLVPHAFRKHLPGCLKDYLRHDVLLLCLVCFRRAEEAAQSHGEGLLRDAGLVRRHTRQAADQERLEVRRAAGALLNPALSEEMRAEKTSIIRAFYGKTEEEALTQEEVDNVRALSCTPKRPNEEAPIADERIVVEKLGLMDSKGGDCSVEGIQAFVVAWRRTFLRAVEPRFLPEGWDVNWQPEQVTE